MLCATKMQDSLTPATLVSGRHDKMQIPATNKTIWRNAILATLAAFLLAIVLSHRAAAASNENAEGAAVGPPLEVVLAAG